MTDGDTATAPQQLLPQGEYRLAGANGSDVNLSHAITVSVTDDMIETVSQCVTQRWTYRYVDDRLRTEPIIEPVCDRGRYPEEEAIGAVFDDPQEVMRTPANGIYIVAAGRASRCSPNEQALAASANANANELQLMRRALGLVANQSQ